MRFSARIGLAILFAVGGGPAAAQVPGLPVVNAGTARGLTLGAMVAFLDEAEGGGTAVGAVGAFGFRRLAVGAGVAGLTGSTMADGTVGAFGGSLAYKLAGGPLVPFAVNVLTGVGYRAEGGGADPRRRRLRIPLGVGISWTIPQPVVAVRPWVAPRIDHERSRVPDPLADPLPGAPGPLVTRTSTELALSAGVTLGFLSGLGLDLVFDRVFGGADGRRTTTLGVGASWSLR